MTRVLLFATIFTVAAVAQEFPTSAMRVSGAGVTATFGPPRAGPLVTGAPYWAEQQMPDGGVIARYARDSQGRVAGCAYLLDEDSTVAHRMKLPAAVASTPGEDNLEAGGVRGFRMTRLSRSEPNPTLFRPPADYRVVDEPAPFTMTFQLKGMR